MWWMDGQTYIFRQHSVTLCIGSCGKNIYTGYPQMTNMLHFGAIFSTYPFLALPYPPKSAVQLMRKVRLVSVRSEEQARVSGGRLFDARTECTQYYKKLRCCRGTARCLVSLNISLSHWRSFEMTPLSRACISLLLETMTVSRTISELFSVK